MHRRRWRRKIGIVSALAATALASLGAFALNVPRSAHAEASLAYTFEDGAEGFTAPSWLSANNGQPAQSAEQHSEGTHSLALPVVFGGGGWDQAGADKVLDNYNAVDLSGYKAVSYDIYTPVANVWSDLVFNDPWNPPANPKPLQPGWNTLTFDISPTSADYPNSGTYFSTAKEFILRAIGRGATYTGPIYFDNVRFIPSTNPTVQIVAPRPDATLSVPQGQGYRVQARVAPSFGRQISGVTFKTPTQSGALTLDPASGLYTAPWNLWQEGDGLKTITITATDTTGAATTAQSTVLVQNSQLRVRITAPAFDAALRDTATVTAQVQADPRFAVRGVRLDVDGAAVPSSAVVATGDTYSFALNTHPLDDGVHTLRVTAHDDAFSVADLVDVLVENAPKPATFVRADGSRFNDGQPFRYVGWNEYDLFTRSDMTVAHHAQTSEGNIILAGTVIPWRDQIDRQMIEAERNGMSVLRTWAFDDGPGDAYAFQPSLGQYNEDTFQKLDYILASAQRHHMRVILTFANYWNDYGGIQQYARWLGLPNKLQFFSDPQAQAAYRQYVAHLVNRTNTVTGVAYKDDPTVFAWELMNEPRMDCNDDPTPAHQYCDPSGQTLRTWIATMSGYVKSLDAHHMVTTGSEGHGLVPDGPAGTGFQWAGTQEGNDNSPLMVQDVPSIDFFTYHPYPNASWANLTLDATRRLVVNITADGVRRGKPVVMEEYGLDKSLPLFDAAGRAVQPADAAYTALWTHWYAEMLGWGYDAGGAGSNVWMLADWSDTHYNVNPYLPQADATQHAPLMAVFRQMAGCVAAPGKPCEPDDGR